MRGAPSRNMAPRLQAIRGDPRAGRAPSSWSSPRHGPCTRARPGAHRIMQHYATRPSGHVMSQPAARCVLYTSVAEGAGCAITRHPAARHNGTLCRLVAGPAPRLPKCPPPSCASHVAPRKRRGPRHPPGRRDARRKARRCGYRRPARLPFRALRASDRLSGCSGSLSD